MGRNYYVKRDVNMYDDIDMRSSYNAGFWQGTFLTLIFSGCIVLGSLYYLGFLH